jgi:hypothetical protein
VLCDFKGGGSKSGSTCAVGGLLSPLRQRLLRLETRRLRRRPCLPGLELLVRMPARAPSWICKMTS